MKVHYSSARHDWETPQAFFDALDAEFGFELDVCATPENAKCERYFSPSDDGLAQTWEGMCWMNPPYGRAIVPWVQKAYHESRKPGTVVVALVPARTDTRWWHRYVMRAAEVRLVQGRLQFAGARTSAPFPSAVAVWHTLSDGPPRVTAMDRDAIKVAVR